MKPVKLYWWEHPDPDIKNFGDALNPYIVKMVSGRPVERTSIDECDLIAIGSVIEHAIQANRDTPVYLWGTGFICDGVAVEDKRLCCSALRGHLTAQQIKDVRNVPLGDAGLLCNLLVNRQPTKKYLLGIVTHFADLNDPVVKEYGRLGRYKIISPLSSVMEFIRSVAECEVILSSSLHGCITADAFGIPNKWLKLSNRVIGDGFKFHDYLSVFGAEDTEPFFLPEPSLINDDVLENLVSGYQRPGLEKIQKQIIDAFPSI